MIRRLIEWAKGVLPAKMLKVPFSEIEEGQVFWFQGECYIKENETAVFRDRPEPRTFRHSELVEITRN